MFGGDLRLGGGRARLLALPVPEVAREGDMEKNERAIWEQLKRIADAVEKMAIRVPDAWIRGEQRVRNQEVKDEQAGAEGDGGEAED